MDLENTIELATVAGVQQSKGPVQALYYSETWMKEDYRLLELSDELSSLLTDGDTLTIRGEGEDEAVLCTKNKTFELKAADTSNCLLLLPSAQTPKTHDFSGEMELIRLPVLSSFNSYFEVKPSRARLGRLKQILKEHCFSGNTQDTDSRLTTEMMLDTVQASEEELIEGLKQLGAIQHENHWIMLEINYQEKAFSQILALVEEKCWSWKKIPLNETCDMLNELYPSFVLKHCLNNYGEEIDKENRIYCLNEEKVCIYYAEYILRPALGKFNFHEFISAWEESVPDGMTTSLDQLKGIALVDMKNHPPVIWHFSEQDLPDTPAERFTLLFKARPKWKEDDITPYLKNILGPNQKMSSLFLKYARSSKDENGDKIYSTRQI